MAKPRTDAAVAEQTGDAATGAPRSQRPGRFANRHSRAAWMFAAPALLFVGVVTIFPILFSVVASFSNVTVSAHGFQLSNFTTHNYSLLWNSDTWRYSVLFTIAWAIATVGIELVIGTAIALVLERLTDSARGWMMALLLIPWAIITVISAELWSYIYNGVYGVLTVLAGHLGFHNVQFLGSNALAITSLMIAEVWKTTPFVVIIVLAGLVMIPGDLYEAAALDGANGWSTFWRVTVPMLKPTIALVVLFRFLQAFGLFDLPFVLTQGAPGHSTEPLALLAYKVMFGELNFGAGAAVATSTAAIVLVGCLVFVRLFRAQVGRDA